MVSLTERIHVLSLLLFIDVGAIGLLVLREVAGRVGVYLPIVFFVGR